VSALSAKRKSQLSPSHTLHLSCTEDHPHARAQNVPPDQDKTLLSLYA